MNREDIIRMGRQAGALIEAAQEKDLLWLERFAALVASAQLEEVAKEFEKMIAFEKDTMASFAAFVRGMKK